MLMSNVVQVHDHRTEHETLAKPKSYPNYVLYFLILRFFIVIIRLLL